MPARILHAPTDVGGHAFELSRAERELGLESDVVVFGRSELGYGADFAIDLAGLSAVGFGSLGGCGFLRAAAKRYDIFHFNFGHAADRAAPRRPRLHRAPPAQAAREDGPGDLPGLRRPAL